MCFYVFQRFHVFIGLCFSKAFTFTKPFLKFNCVKSYSVVKELASQTVSSDRTHNRYPTNSRQLRSQLFHCLLSSSWSTLLDENTFNVNLRPHMSNKSSKLGPSSSITKALYFPQGPETYKLGHS